ncbi:MAG: hypothetical protein ACYCVB_08870 [Bacilli bacterium]
MTPGQNPVTGDADKCGLSAPRQALTDLMPMWAEQAAGLSTATTAADVVRNIDQQVARILDNLLSQA